MSESPLKTADPAAATPHETAHTTAHTTANTTPHTPPATTPPATLGIAGLEAVYDTLAQAIDQAGAAQSELFLVKLALLQAEALGDADRFAQLVQAALQDLQPQAAQAAPHAD